MIRVGGDDESEASGMMHMGGDDAASEMSGMMRVGVDDDQSVDNQNIAADNDSQSQ